MSLDQMEISESEKHPYPFISVVIPVFNASKTIEQLISSLVDQSYPKEKYEIIFVDDHSTDRTVEIIESFAKKVSRPSIKVIQLKRNCGPAAARNRGVTEAKGEILAFTDADVIVDRDWLRELAKCFDDENIGGVHGEILTDSYLLFPIRVAPVGGGYKTCNIAYRKEVLYNVGLFDERFKHPFGEDGDLAHRVLKKGFRVKYCPKARVLHPVKEKGIMQVVQMALLRRYDVLFFKKHPYDARNYGERFMRPVLVMSPFLGLSLTGICLLLYFAIAFTSLFDFAYFLIGSLITTGFFLTFFFLFFMFHGYKVIFYGDNTIKLTTRLKAKCFIALLIFYLTAVISRIYGSIKYRALMI